MFPTLASGSWISSTLFGGAMASTPVPYFRKSFSLDRPFQSARLAITALGLYEAEINAVRVGDEVFAPGWTDYHKKKRKWVGHSY